MAEEEVVYSKEDGIGIITLNRPEKLNALAFEQQQRLGSLVEEVKRDEDVRVVILTGAGRAFCAGADISGGDLPSVKQAGSFRDRGINDAKKRTSTYDPGTLWSINSIAKPTICAINGAAVGMGAEYTLLCDIRIASETARWGQVFVLRGVVPDHGAGTYLLPRIVGLSKACELVFSGKIIDAEEMLRIGLVNEVVPPDQLMPAAMAMANELKKGSNSNYGYIGYKISWLISRNTGVVCFAFEKERLFAEASKMRNEIQNSHSFSSACSKPQRGYTQ